MYQNQELERDLQLRRRQIVELNEVENMHRYNIDTLQNDIDHLFNERSQLQQFVLRFTNTNRRYIQINRIAEQVVDGLLAERKSHSDCNLVCIYY